MTPFHRRFHPRTAAMAVLLPAILAACGGGSMDPILGPPGLGAAPAVPPVVVPGVPPVVPPVVPPDPGPNAAPTVSASTPAADAVNVVTNARLTATFSEPMAPASLSPTSFRLACPAGTPVTAAVAYDSATQTATLTPAAALPASTLCTATVSTAVQDSAGLAMAADHVWQFNTAALADTTRPTVTVVVPTAGDAAVATNSGVSASFSEPMDAATVGADSFTLASTATGTPVAGVVSYAAAARTATFRSTAALAAGTQYTATLRATVADLVGNGLAGNAAVAPGAGNHSWTFTTAAAGDTAPPTVTAISPLDGSTGLCLSKAVNATFSEPMDPATVNALTFRVTANGVAVPGVVRYDAASRVATFMPAAPAGFAPSQAHAVTVRGGVDGAADLAGNRLVADRNWGFSTGTQPCMAPVRLGSAALFGAFGGAAGVTNEGINTVVNGHLGTTAACTLVIGFHDAAAVYTETPLNVGGVNGSVQCAPPAPGTATSMAAATLARADALVAYNQLAAMPPGGDPGAGQLGGQVLTAGVYTSAGGTFAITTGDLTLDAQGDSAAVWVFQSGAALTVGLGATPRRVLLVNGAQAANVYWQVGSAARIEDGSVMVGTIIAPAGVTISTAGQTAQTTLTGRAIGLTASVTMVNTTVVAP